MTISTKTRPRFSVSLALALLLASSQVSAGETVVDNARGFTLTLPDGFAPKHGLVGTAPNIIHTFVLGDPDDNKLHIMLFIEEMRGTIGRERLKPEDMPPAFQGRLFTTNWQGYELDAFEVPERLGEMATVTYNVQIPLKKAAIQVKLFGPADRESDLKRLLAEVLNGLKGESNWIPSASPASPVTSSENYGFTLLGFAIAFVLGGLVVLFLISKRTPRGTVLAMAAGISIASWGIDGIRVREVVMLTGAMRMLGFAGGILGIVDLVRKRRPRDLGAS